MLEGNSISLGSVCSDYLEISTAVCVPHGVSLVYSYFIVTIITAMELIFDFILYVPSTIFQLYRDGYSWVEPVLS